MPVIIDATPGKLIYNEAIPQDLGFVDRSVPGNELKLEIDFLVEKKMLGKILDKCFRKYGPTRTAEVLDKIKAMGYKYSTKAALTVSVSDMVIPKEKPIILANAEKEIDKIDKLFRRGLISEDERYERVIDTWNKAVEEVTDALMRNLDKSNPIYMMSHSGARGSVNQIRQLAGMRGLMGNTSGRIIELPIRSNFREGLSSLEFFISTHGARKGLADTALRTADSGYLTRRLVDVSQDVIVREEDCGTDKGIYVYDFKDGNEVIEKLEDRLTGRTAAEDVVDPKTGELIVEKNHEMNENDAARIVKAGITKVKIRSILTCESSHGICAKCYGRDLATGKNVKIGESVGIIAAQAIGEPGTQLTMRTFHTGGVAGADITQGLPRVEELFEARKPKGLAIISDIAGTVKLMETKKKREVVVTNNDMAESKTYLIPYGAKLKVSDGEAIEAGHEITEGSINPHDILRIKGEEAVQTYFIQEVQRVYRLQGVEINDKHIEIIIRLMMRKAKVDEEGDTNLLPGTLMDIGELKEINKNITASGGEPCKYKITILGITKASLATDSFLSAASFQETTRVLTDAAIKGKVDPLIGLKENVIIGKLIPAGTGLTRYKNIVVKEQKEQDNVDTDVQ